MYGNTNHLDEVKKRLDSVSPCFCIAKWKHCSLHLLNGTTHSCYLPPVHKIPTQELSRSPAALHNTHHKKLQRRAMLEGRRPAECHICWTMEDLPKSPISNRILRSSESWARDHLEEIRGMPWDADVMPSYLEVSFSPACNFKCSYCSPHVSSSWLQEIRSHGPYKLSTNEHQDLATLKDLGWMPIEDEEQNPYIHAFWKWWPDLVNQLKTFRITGGEPLLSPQTFKILQWFLDNPAPGLALEINSNISVSEAGFAKFMALAEQLTTQKKVRWINLHTSIDTQGAQAEYIRYGLNYNQFLQRVRQYLNQVPEGRLSFMSTFCALSVVGFRRLLADLTAIRNEFETQNREIHIDIPHLTAPAMFSAQILTPDFAQLMEGLIIAPDLKPVEREKLRRISAWMAAPPSNDDLNRLRADFYLFFKEHDRRRGTNFLTAFGEMRNFWMMCHQLAESRK